MTNSRSSDEPTGLTPMQLGKLSIFKHNESAFANYGFAISNFSSIEFGMLFLFLKLGSGSEEDIINSYWNINSPRGRFEWVKKRIKVLPGKDHVIKAWNDIVPRLDRAITVRNDLAHGELTPIHLSQDRAIIGFWAQFARSSSRGILSYNPRTSMIDGTRFYAPEELESIGLEYIYLGEALAGLADQWNELKN